VHDLTGNISAKYLNEFILFSASPRDDNEFHIQLQCKLWPWLMVILKFWSTTKLLLGPSWSYGSWIYNHIRNQSPITTNVRIPLRRGVLDTKLYTYSLGMRVIALLLFPRYQLLSEATPSTIVGTEGTIQVLLPEYQVYKCFIILNKCAIQNSKL
jgi:hypothetical protein